MRSPSSCGDEDHVRPGKSAALLVEAAARNKELATTAPVPIWRCGSPDEPMVGNVAVPTIRSGVGEPPPVSASTVSPIRLCNDVNVAGPSTTSSAD